MSTPNTGSRINAAVDDYVDGDGGDTTINDEAAQMIDNMSH